MITEYEKALQIRVQHSPSPCHISFINHEHGCKHYQKMIEVLYFFKEVSSRKDLIEVCLSVDFNLYGMWSFMKITVDTSSAKLCQLILSSYLRQSRMFVW